MKIYETYWTNSENFINKDLRVGWQHGHKNGHDSGPRASSRARIWHATYYHIPRGFAMPKAANLNRLWALKHFWGVIRVHHPINRGPVSSL